MEQSASERPAAADANRQSGPEGEAASTQARSHKQRRYGPRTCRICLDSEEPRFPPGTAPSSSTSTWSRPIYVSDDPALGRLLSPCKCKGSQKYVHEGCLNSWRLSNPTAKQNYWQCPTCQFSYRLVRLHWASMLSSKLAQAALTFVILLMGIFLLGFLADPILNLWSDPVGTISHTVTIVVTDIEALETPVYDESTTWSEHFLKGFFSLGLIGFFKSMLAVSPWHWWNLRGTGLMGSNRRQGTGRARVENISLVFVVLGAVTALMGIWKAVKKLSERFLRRMSERVLDVGRDDDDDDDDGFFEAKDEKKDQ